MCPSISVILVNYNHACYLPQSIQAIIQQSMLPEEVIIIDDASCDDSVALIREFEKRYPCIRAVFRADNEGVLASVKQGLQMSSGEYICNLAADDPLMPGFFRAAGDLCLRYPQAGIVFAEYTTLFPDGSTRGWHERLCQEARFFSPQDFRNLYRIRKRLSIPTNPALWKKKELIHAGGHPDELLWHADWFAAIVMGMRHGACHIPRPFQYVRMDDSSFSRSGMRDRQALEKLLLNLFARLEKPEYQDVRDGFGIAAVLSRFGLLVVHCMLQDPRFEKYLTYELVQAACEVDGVVTTMDPPPDIDDTTELVKISRKLLIANGFNP